MARNPLDRYSSRFMLTGIQLILMLVAGLTLLNACQVVPDEIDTPPVELEVSTGFGDLWGEAEQVVFARFEELHPHIQVKSKEQDLSWQNSVTQSPLPDLLFGGAGYDLRQVSQRNRLANLTDLWQQSGVDEAFPTSIQQVSVIDGNQYYLPMVMNWVAIYYNIETFTRYHLTPPQTWDELLIICDTLFADGVTPLAFGPAGWTGMYWFDYLNLRLNGADFHRTLLEGKERFDDERVQKVFDTWQTLLAHNCFGERVGIMSSVDSRTAVIHNDEGALGRQKSAMTLISSWEVGTLAEQFQNEVDFFRFPRIDPSVPVAEIVWSHGYAIPIGAEDVAEAMEFLTYMSSVEAQTILAQGLGSTAISAHINIDDKVLHSSQVNGQALIGKADNTVVVQLMAFPSTMSSASERALYHFIHHPEEINAVQLILEEGRQRAIEQGLFD